MIRYYAAVCQHTFCVVDYFCVVYQVVSQCLQHIRNSRNTTTHIFPLKISVLDSGVQEDTWTKDTCCD